MQATSDVWIVLPAYNEGRVIRRVIGQLATLPYHVVIVDDGSTDDTLFQAQRSASRRMVVLSHVCNLGQGAALQTGMTFALRAPNVRHIVTFDADEQHHIRDIDALLAPLRAGEFDVVLGSRFLDGAQTVGMQPLKRLLLKLAILFTRLTTGLRVTDTHNGLRAFTVEAASRLTITQNRMAHASELLALIAQHRLRYREIPCTVSYTDYSRAKGQSMLNSVNVLWEILVGRMR